MRTTAEVTEEFLTFSAQQGNDLRQIGLKGGCKWCLCASRWREAFEARKGDDDRVVPRCVVMCLCLCFAAHFHRLGQTG